MFASFDSHATHSSSYLSIWKYHSWTVLHGLILAGKHHVLALATVCKVICPDWNSLPSCVSHGPQRHDCVVRLLLIRPPCGTEKAVIWAKNRFSPHHFSAVAAYIKISPRHDAGCSNFFHKALAVVFAKVQYLYLRRKLSASSIESDHFLVAHSVYAKVMLIWNLPYNCSLNKNAKVLRLYCTDL